jgi:hypothetical protein
MLQIALLFAELERGRIVDNWQASHRDAAEQRNIHLTPHVPLGYRQHEKKEGGGVETSPLEIDPTTEPLVCELFRMRARVASGAELAS